MKGGGKEAFGVEGFGDLGLLVVRVEGCWLDVFGASAFRQQGSEARPVSVILQSVLFNGPTP